MSDVWIQIRRLFDIVQPRCVISLYVRLEHFHPTVAIPHAYNDVRRQYFDFRSKCNVAFCLATIWLTYGI